MYVYSYVRVKITNVVVAGFRKTRFGNCTRKKTHDYENGGKQNLEARWSISIDISR